MEMLEYAFGKQTLFTCFESCVRKNVVIDENDEK